MVLLDTDTLTYFFESHARVTARMQACTDPNVGTTIINRVEVLRGRFEFLLKAEGVDEFLRAQALLRRTEALLNPMLIVPLDSDALQEFERLRRLKGLKKIG